MKKQKIVIICFVFLTTLFIYSCSATYQDNSSATATSTLQITPSNIPITSTPYTAPTLPSDSFVVSLPTREDVLVQMYGKDVNIYSDDKASIRTTQPDVTYDINVNLFSCHYEWHTEVCLVITDRSHDSCHECGAHIDGAVFERSYKGWRLRSLRSNIIEAGSYGHLTNKGEIIQIGTEKYAAQIKWVYSNSENSYERLIVIAENENSFEVVLNLVSRVERLKIPFTADRKIEYGWNTSLDFIQVDKGNRYYDLIVTYFGSEKDMPYLEHYVFTDGKYTLVP